MQQHLTSVGSSRRMRLVAVLLLMFMLGAVALPAVQAQRQGGYLFMSQNRDEVGENPRSKVKVTVDRVLFSRDKNHEVNFRVCGSGSATWGVDYELRIRKWAGPFNYSGNCVTAKFPRGVIRVNMNIKPIADTIDESNETIILKVSQDSSNRFPPGYRVMPSYSTVRVNLIDND